MARTTGTNLNSATTGSAGDVTYFQEDIQAVLAQTGAVNIASVFVRLKNPLNGIPPENVTAMVAVDNTGNQLTGGSHLFALPCPPYC